MMTLHANDLETTPSSGFRAASLPLAERRAKLLAAQTAYRALVAKIWGPGNTLLVTAWDYEHYSMYELQSAWQVLSYWRGQVADAERAAHYAGRAA